MNWTNILTVAIILSIIAILSRLECTNPTSESFFTQAEECPYGYTLKEKWETNYCIKEGCWEWEFK